MTAARPLAALISGVVVLSLATVPSEATKVPLRSDITYQTWTSSADFLSGTRAGTTVTGDSLTFGTAAGTTSYVDPFGDGSAKSYDQTSWTSPPVATSFGLTELIASWNATTPPGTWVEVAMAGRTDLGTTTKWYVLGRWTGGDDTAAGDIHRTSVPSQGDTNGSVAVDTFVAATGRSLNSWQLKVTLYRLSGTTQSASGQLDRGNGVAAAQREEGPRQPTRWSRRTGARRTDVLAGDPHRPLPAVGQRR